MTSDKQINANRRNATASTGAKTARGKALVRLNAAKHGLYSESRLLPGEDRRLYHRLAVDIVDFFRPIGPVEETLTDQILYDVWRLKRYERAEHSMFERFHEGRALKILHGFTACELGHLRQMDTKEIREAPTTFRAMPNNDKSAGCHEQTGCWRGDCASDGSLDARRHLAAKLTEANDWDLTILEAILPAQERAPLARIEALRRAIMRSYLGYVATLKALQDERRTFNGRRLDE